MKELTRSRVLAIVGFVAVVFAVVLVLGAVFGTLSSWDVIYGVGAAVVGASVVLLTIKAIQSANSKSDSTG